MHCKIAVANKDMSTGGVQVEYSDGSYQKLLKKYNSLSTNDKYIFFDPLTLFDCQIFVGNKGESYRYVYPLNPSDVVYKIILGRARKMEKHLNFHLFG